MDFDSTYNFPPDSRKTIVVSCGLSDGRITEVGFRPAYISRMSVPELLEPDDPRFAEVTDYLRDMGARAGLETRLEPDGNLVRVVGT